MATILARKNQNQKSFFFHCRLGKKVILTETSRDLIKFNFIASHVYGIYYNITILWDVRNEPGCQFIDEA